MHEAPLSMRGDEVEYPGGMRVEGAMEIEIELCEATDLLYCSRAV